GKQYIAGLQARERERTGISSLKVGFNKVFGYYLEITNPHRDRVPADYERRQTLSGAERFVTPELKAYEAKVLGAEEGIAAREAQLVDALHVRVAQAIARVQTTAGVLARLDVWGALSDVAHREGYVRPEVNHGFTIMLEGSRHPVVERMMAREAFIPNDVLLDEAGRVILLTGPNMAGKSTLLRQVGLCVVLAQMGAFVPARRAVVGVVDRLFTRVGASDNLVRGQSTFMVEMSETGARLHGRRAGPPAPVVGRAWQVLALLEAGHHVAHQAPPAPPDAAQLGLFNPLGSPHPLLEELDRLDVNTLSPLDALNRLAAWKKQLAEGHE